MTLSTADKVIAVLQAYQLKQVGAGKYRCISPLRTDAKNPESFSLIIEGPEHGAFHDFKSDEKGSLYDLAKRLNIEIERAAVTDTKRKYRDLVDYANAHGVAAEVFARAGWKLVTKDERPALQFTTATGDRWRFLDGEKPVYKSVVGYKKCWYGVERAFKTVDAEHPLVICNGEASTVAGQHYGVAATCVTSGEGKLPDELIRQLDGKFWTLPADTLILIAFDCDSKGRSVALEVQTQLRTFGYTQARAVDLRLGNKGDLADFCILHEQNAAKLLLTLPSLEDSHQLDDFDDDEPLRIYDIMEFHNLPKIKWIVPAEIPEASFVMLYGQSNVGKSFIALDYALRIALRAPVVYIALEGESGIPVRVWGWCSHNKVRPEQLQFKMLVGNVDLYDKAGVERLIAILKPVCPLFVVVDTYRHAIGIGDENRAVDMVQVMRGSKRLKRILGCALMFVHHTNKAGEQESGSYAFRGRMDTVIKVSPDDDLIRVESEKSRDLAKFQPKSIKLLPVLVDGEGETLVPIPADQYVRGNDLTPDQRKILDVLAMEIFSQGASRAEIANLTGFSDGKIVRALNNLVKKDFVTKPGKGLSPHHRITNDGRMALGLEAVEEDDDTEKSDRVSKSDRSKVRTRSSDLASSDRVDRVDRADSVNLHVAKPVHTRKVTDQADQPDQQGEKPDRSDEQPDQTLTTPTLFDVGEIPARAVHQYAEGS